MKIEFKNGLVKECSNIVEQKTFVAGTAKGWILSGSIMNTSSSEADSMFIPDNFSQIKLYNDNELQDEPVCTLNGYTKLNSVTIRYSDGFPVAVFQITKEA